MHFKQDFKRFVRKHLNTTLQKGILILNYVKSLSQLALNISKSFLRVGRKTPNEYPMPSWKAQISTAQMSHLCTSIMDIKKEAATMLQARAPPSGFPSPGDGKWSHKRLNVIVVVLTLTMIITLFHCAWWGLESPLTSQTLAVILNFGAMNYSGAGHGRWMDIYKWKHWISSAN